MTETTVTAAVAVVDNSPGGMVQQYRGDFATVLPSHIKADTWVRLAQGILRRDRNLLRIATSNPGSFMSALLECARLGHEPGTPAFYFVPFGSEIQGIEGYRGKIDRIYRAGAVSSVVAEVVYEKDTYSYTPGPGVIPHHIPADVDDPGPLVRVYAYAQMKDGSISRVIRMRRSEVEKHMRESKGWDKPSSPWKRWTESMWLKTALHELEKWVPSSTEYMREQLRIRAEVAAERRPEAGQVPPPASRVPVAEPVTGPIEDDDQPVDAEFVDEEPIPDSYPQAQWSASRPGGAA